MQVSSTKMARGLITGLTRQGLTAKAAIGRIYSTYGIQTSETRIIIAFKFDKKHQQRNPTLTF